MWVLQAKNFVTSSSLRASMSKLPDIVLLNLVSDGNQPATRNNEKNELSFNRCWFYFCIRDKDKFIFTLTPTWIFTSVPSIKDRYFFFSHDKRGELSAHVHPGKKRYPIPALCTKHIDTCLGTHSSFQDECVQIILHVCPGKKIYGSRVMTYLVTRQGNRHL